MICFSRKENMASVSARYTMSFYTTKIILIMLLTSFVIMILCTLVFAFRNCFFVLWIQDERSAVCVSVSMIYILGVHYFAWCWKVLYCWCWARQIHVALLILLWVSLEVRKSGIGSTDQHFKVITVEIHALSNPTESLRCAKKDGSFYPKWLLLLSQLHVHMYSISIIRYVGKSFYLERK